MGLRGSRHRPLIGGMLIWGVSRQNAAMGIQDRDYWKERYDQLNGRGRWSISRVRSSALRFLARAPRIETQAQRERRQGWARVLAGFAFWIAAGAVVILIARMILRP